MQKMDNFSSKSRESGFSYVGKYKVLQFLGKGGTAKVKLALDTVRNIKVALKIFRDPAESKMKIKHSLEQVTQEFKVIEHLKHPNLLNVIEILENTFYERKNGEKYLTTTIVLEYADGGEVFDYVAQFQNFSEAVARTYFVQLMKGIEYLHQNGICHRDIKMENLLLDSNYKLKIGDFGFARDLTGPNKDGKLFSRLGTEGYQAAEIKELKYYSGEKVDIFACGVVLFLFIAGRPPFEAAATNNRWYRTFQEKKLDFWKFQNKYSNFPPQLCRLLDKMMHHYFDRRANLDYIWKNEWVNGPILTDQQLYEEMHKKHQVLKQKQKEEREKKKQQKLKMKEQLRQTEQQLEEGKINQVKIFRSDEKQNERYLVLEKYYNLQQVEEQFSKCVKTLHYFDETSITSKLVFESPQETIKLLLNQLINLNLCVETPQIVQNSSTIRCISLVKGEEIRFNIKLYKEQQQQEKKEEGTQEDEEEEENTIVQFHHQEGNKFQFYDLVMQIKNRLDE